MAFRILDEWMGEMPATAGRRPAPWSRPCDEPSIDEVLEERIVQILMCKDHVSREELLALIAFVRDTRNRRV